MPFCTKCGKQINQGEVCSCQNANPAPQRPTQPGGYAPQGSYAPPAPQAPKAKKLPPCFPKNPNEPISSYILPYLGIFWLFGLLIKPDKMNPRIRFHVGQGMFLTIAYAAVSVALGILSLFSLIPYIGIVFTVLNVIVGIAAEGGLLVLNVWAIINVCKGKDEFIPLIGQFAFYK